MGRLIAPAALGNEQLQCSGSVFYPVAELKVGGVLLGQRNGTGRLPCVEWSF